MIRFPTNDFKQKIFPENKSFATLKKSYQNTDRFYDDGASKDISNVSPFNLFQFVS
jgi:hypothetical protein